MDTDVLNTCSASYNRKSDRPHNLSGEVDSTVPPGSLSQSVSEDHSYTRENPTINNYGLWIVQFRREVCPKDSKNTGSEFKGEIDANPSSPEGVNPGSCPRAQSPFMGDRSKTERIPPIVLRDKSGWFGISAEIKRRGYNFLKAQNIADGIRLFPATESDFRGIAKFFRNEQIPFHTFQLPSEKGLNVVIRGIPSEIPESEALGQLRELGFNPDSVARMRKNRKMMARSGA
ncbi:hypothetical protein QE152_g32561 [Popillia japonica]|uniref:Uncharacterized protein n=1 Tax=Popillia japonica TaxID=7064 RepID=A0AAW1IZ62_POPJA